MGSSQTKRLGFSKQSPQSQAQTPQSRNQTPPTLIEYCERTTGFALEAWQRIVCDALEPIAKGEVKGKRLLIHGPPQYGKSIIISQRFPSYTLGVQPESRLRVACYNVTHAERFSKVNLALMQSDEFAQMFPHEGARVPQRVSYEEWSTVARAGKLDANPSFKPLGLGTGFTGMGVDTLVIDDPYKNRDEARSEAVNDSLRGWWTDVVLPRLNPATNVIVMFHRWWEGDFAGYLIEQGGWDLLRFPAIADGLDHDPTGRNEGEPLSPRYPLSYLEKIKKEQGDSFYALYQGTPYPASGSMFKVERAEIVEAAPRHMARVRRWDKAATAGGGDFTVGLLMGAHNGVWYVEDVVRGQWSTDERDAVIRQTAALDKQMYGDVQIIGPQDPGSAGVSDAQAFVRMLAGYRVKTVRESGDKVTRADPFASQWNAGNVKIVAGAWNQAYLSEMRAFPNGKNDDQVDTSSGAFDELQQAHTGYAMPYDTRRKR